ncbi:hypothetical protein EVB37_075 [Rhizobium phage RHph_TM3_3_3]|nr:hypothetical protein EVB37_075 [Rhizobium phage RHph_TM3_3_3]
MRRTDIDDDREESLAGPSPSVVGPDRRLDAVIPFRRASVPPRPAAEASPPEASAPFQDLGSVTQAVVMRLANKRIRIRVAGPGREEDDRGQL